MAYTPSTGMHSKGILRDQYSTQADVLHFSSGSRLVLQEGARFEDENFTEVTSSGVYGTTVPSRGVVYLNPASSGNVTVQLAAPDYAGQRVWIIVQNSSKKDARVVTGDTAVTFATTEGQMLHFTTEASFKYGIGGHARTGCELLALSTAKWAVISPHSTVNGFMDLSTARSS